MSSSKNLEYRKTSFLNKSNSAFIEEMYLRYLNDDPDLEDSWKEYFQSIKDEMDIIINDINGPSWKPAGNRININNVEKIIETNGNAHQQSSDKFNFQVVANSNKESISAVALIRAYRLRGHLLAKLDPLGMMQTDYLDELHPEYYGFDKKNYDKKIELNGVINKDKASVREILQFLKKTYCGPVGYEYMHISNL